MNKSLRIVLTALVALVLLAPAAAASSPPPGPGAAEPRPSSIAGCWKWTLERKVERRTVQLSGHTFVEFRTVATVLRWCPSSGYVVVTWRGPWGPGRR